MCIVLYLSTEQDNVLYILIFVVCFCDCVFVWMQKSDLRFLKLAFITPASFKVLEEVCSMIAHLKHNFLAFAVTNTLIYSNKA